MSTLSLRDLGFIAAGQATATPITLFGSKLEGWYAPSGPFTEVSGAVSQWDDLSGNGRHKVQATATLRPVRGTFAGRTAVIYDGVDDYMDTAGSNLPMKLAIIACFGYPNNSSVPPFAWSAAGSTTVNRTHELHLNSNGSIRGINNEPGPYADTPTGTTESFYDDCTMAGAYGTPTDLPLRAHLNGRSVSTNAGVTSGSKATFPMRFGRRGELGDSGTGLPSAARFTEIIMISDWTVLDIEKAEGYLAWKHGGNPLSRLIGTHPYKSAAPTV